MGERGPEPGGGRAGGGDARDDHDLGRRRRARRQLPGHAPHAVDARVAAGDQGDGLALLGQVEREPGPLDLLAELAADDRLAGEPVGDQVEVAAIADDRVGRVDRRRGVGRQQAGRAGAEPDDVQRSRVGSSVEFIVSAYQDQREVGQVFPERPPSGRGRSARRAGRPARPAPRGRAGRGGAAPRRAGQDVGRLEPADRARRGRGSRRSRRRGRSPGRPSGSPPSAPAASPAAPPPRRRR